MKRTYAVLCISLMPCLLFAAKPGYGEENLDEILSLAKAVPLSETAARFSRLADPEVNTAAVKEQIREMTARLRPLLENKNSPEEKVRALADFIHQQAGFHSKLQENSDPRYGYYDGLLRLGKDSAEDIYRSAFLAPVLANKEGNCLGLTSLYLVLAEELGLPIYPVIMPYHIFPRYDDGKVRLNIEATAGGQIFSDAFYAQTADLSAEAIKNGAYLQTLPRHDLFSAYCLALGSFYNARGLPQLARQSYEKALLASPQLTLAYTNLALVYAYYQFHTAWESTARQALALDPEFLGAYLGLSQGFIKEGEPASAILIMREAVKKHPEVAHAHAVLGELYLNEGLLDEAEKEFRQAQQLAPWDAEFYLSLGWVYYYRKDFIQARALAAEALKHGARHNALFNKLKTAEWSPTGKPAVS